MGAVLCWNSVGQIGFKSVNYGARLFGKLMAFFRQFQRQRPPITGQTAHKPPRFQSGGDRRHIGALNIQHAPERTLGNTGVSCHNLKNCCF